MRRTEERIIRTYETLLNEVPYSRITVRSLSERCGINHNTFYYYFRNIEDLNRRLLEVQLEKAASLAAGSRGRHDTLNRVLADMEAHKTAILNLYRHMDLQTFLDTLERVAQTLSEICAQKDCDSIPEDARQTLLCFYRAVLFGLLIEWLRADMSYDLGALIREITALEDVIRS